MPRSQATVNTSFNATDRMKGPMNQMQRRVSGFSRNTQRSLGSVSQGFRTLRRVAGVALAAMTTGAVARAVTDFAAAGDEVAKMSRELGLGAESLQELRFAADRQGVSSDDLEKSLGALNNRVGMLRQNQGSLATALNNSNPELAEQLRNAKDTDEAFTIMMDALNGTENAADRAALAQAAFGRSGQSLVRMAEAGTEGLDDLRQEARDLGLVMSDEATANAELFQDSLTNLKGSMRGVINGALVPLIERLQPLIAQMSEWVKANQELIQQRIERVFKGIAEAGRTIARLWDNGVIPAVLAGVVAFKAISTAVAVFQTVTIAAKGVMLAFNAVMAANPIGLVIIGIAALIAVVVLLVKNWDKVRKVWDAVVTFIVQKVFDLARRIQETGQAITNAFLTARDAVREAWESLLNWFMEKLQPIVDLVERTIGKVQDIGGGIADAARGVGDRIGNVFDGDDSTGLFSRGRATNETISRSESVSRSEVGINIGGLPRGSSVTQRGRAPGVSLEYGAAGGRL
jgi:hypothetical protein